MRSTMSNNIPNRPPVCKVPEKSELHVTCHPSSGGMGAPPATSRVHDYIAFATCDSTCHLDRHLPPTANKSRSVDSMRRPRPTFNLQLLSQRANFSTTSHVTWGGGGGTKYVSRVFTSDWLVVAFYLEFGRSGLLEIGLPVVNRRGSQWKSCYVLCWRYCHCIGTLSQKRVGINFGVDCNFAKQQPRGGSCNPVSDRGATFNPNH